MAGVIRCDKAKWNAAMQKRSENSNSGVDDARSGDVELRRSAAMSHEEVNDRRSLLRYLSQSLRPEVKVIGEDEFRQSSTFVKSYLVEFNDDRQKGYARSWGATFPTIKRTQDPSLLLALDSQRRPFFVDIKDQRFVVLHTIERTVDTDQSLKDLADGHTPGYDRAWLPSSFLLDCHLGDLRGFKFSHEPLANGVSLPSNDYSRKAPTIELPEEISQLEDNEVAQEPEPAVVEKKLDRFGNRRSVMAVRDSATAMDDYSTIRLSEVFANRQSLDWIQYRAFTARGDSILHGLYSNGKVVASGTSIALHLVAMDRLRSAYGSVIRSIEDQYAIGWNVTSQGAQLSGEPLVIKFSERLNITDLELLARSIFRAARPFRLFGFPHRVSERRLDVEAIDLHTRDEFSVELTPAWMRIYLPKGSCGNVVARLYTNLLHTLDSDTTLVDGSGSLLFNFEEQ